jgi:hypothetical protein
MNSAVATLILFMFHEYPDLVPVNPRGHLQRLLSNRIFKNHVCLRGEEGTSICVLVLRAHHDVRSPGRSASLPSQAKRSLGFGTVARFLPCSPVGMSLRSAPALDPFPALVRRLVDLKHCLMIAGRAGLQLRQF